MESIGGLILMLIVAVFVQTQPPRDAALNNSAVVPELPFNDITQVDDLYAHVQVSPDRAGENRFWVHLYRADGTAIGEVQLVRLLFNYRDAELGQASADLKSLGQDVFALDGTYLNQAGSWDLSIYVRRRGVDDAIGQLRLTVPASTRAATASDPWQNPIPSFPADGLLAVIMITLGVIPFSVVSTAASNAPRFVLGLSADRRRVHRDRWIRRSRADLELANAVQRTR